MSHRNRFKKSLKSPFDESGPNAEALRRSLEWLERHGDNTPFHQTSLEMRKKSEQIPAEPSEESAKPEPAADSDSKTDAPAPENNETKEENVGVESPTDEPAQADALPPGSVPAEAPQPVESAEPAETESVESQLPEQEPMPDEFAEPRTVDAALAELDDAQIAGLEDSQIEQSQISAMQLGPTRPILDVRRFPRRYPLPLDPERHERLCAICHHDERDAIELAFLQWRRTADIRYEFHLPSRSCIYRHAHAVGLFEERARAVRFVLENVMEESSAVESTGDTMVRAVRAYSCLDNRGRWVEPPRHLIISRELLPAPPPKRNKHKRTRARQDNRAIDADPNQRVS